jgi:uncharacterized protein (TIGR02217 family)
MSFVEAQFPADISYGSSGGPEYSTDIVMTYGGHEQRNINWSQARARFNVAHGVKTKAQLDTLIAFFRARKGRAVGFRFKDWTDYKATAQVLGTGDGVLTQFQLVKKYVSGATEELRPITKPISGSVKIYLNGVLKTSGLTINYTTGLVIFTVAPAASVVVTADYEFDVPVRFDTDRLSATLDAYGVHSWLDIPLIEVRV